MVQRIISVLILLCFFITSRAQNVGISNDGSLPDNSAILDLKSTTKGLLIPRMLQSDRNNIILPATGLLIWQTNNTPGLYYNSGSPGAPVWQQLGATGPQGLPGTPAASDYAYIYNNGAQVVASAGLVSFSSNGLMTSAFSHVPGSSSLTILSTGIYQVNYSLSAIEANQFELVLNGVAVTYARFGSASTNQQNTGGCLISCTAGDVLSLRNITLSAVTLPNNPGSVTTMVNAAIIIRAI